MCAQSTNHNALNHDYADDSHFKLTNHNALNRFKPASTEQPYSYLLLDLSNEQDELLRLRSNVFPGERQVVFVPK